MTKALLFFNYIKQSDITKEKAIQKHKELNDLAIKAQDAYYNTGSPIMDDYTYDKLFDDIKAIEDQYNYHPSWSVINSTGILTKNEKGAKVTHEEPALSLGKTKDRNELVKFLKDKEGILSLKQDGLTAIATYDNGNLTLFTTRGNGTIGTDVTANGKLLKSLPKTISDKGHVIVRGEYLITYSAFYKINSLLENGEEYKNPRNLSSGTLNSLDPNLIKQRQGEFKVFDLVKCSNIAKLDTYEKQLQYAKQIGFDICMYKKVNASNILDTINQYEQQIPSLDIPSDGLVLRYNDIAYGDSLGMTGHEPKHSIALKWKDDYEETILRDIVFQASRTGRINPVAIFDPIELEGTTVTRATLNNLTFIRNMKLGIGDHIQVIKANKIIPQIINDIEQSNNIQFPTICPSCGSQLKIKNDGAAEFLICDNPICIAKNIKSLELFAGKSGLDIQGISGKTIENIVKLGLLHNYLDFFDLPNHKQELQTLEGFGAKSYNNLCKALDNAKNVEPYKVINALGIPNIGVGTSKDIANELKGNLKELLDIDTAFNNYNLQGILGIVASNSLKTYFNNSTHIIEFQKLLNILNLKQPLNNQSNSNKLNGKVFVITGSLNNYKNRDELVKEIELNGGKVGSSVSKETSYLINNDTTSTSNKNIKAQKLNIPIISEQDFVNLLLC